METFSASLALCEGNPPVTGGFPSQRPETRSFGVSFDLRLNKRLSKQSRRRWFETPLRSSWRHCNHVIDTVPRKYTINISENDPHDPHDSPWPYSINKIKQSKTVCTFDGMYWTFYFGSNHSNATIMRGIKLLCIWFQWSSRIHFNEILVKFLKSLFEKMDLKLPSATYLLLLGLWFVAKRENVLMVIYGPRTKTSRLPWILLARPENSLKSCVTVLCSLRDKTCYRRIL